MDENKEINRQTESQADDGDVFRSNSSPVAADDWTMFDDDTEPSEPKPATTEETPEDDEQPVEAPAASEPEPEDVTTSTDNKKPLPREEGTPICTLKHNGQEVPVYNRHDLEMLAQKGIDYTLKTQALANYRRELAALEAHGDLRAELMRRMQGEAPQAIGGGKAPESDRPTEEEKPGNDLEQRDDETYEEWVQRIAESKAEAKVTSQLQQYQEQQKREALLNSVRADPLHQPTLNVIRAAVNAGQIPPAVLQQADSDPEAFKWIYSTARQAVAQRVQQQKGQQAPQPPSQGEKTSPAPLNKKQPPRTEGGGRSARKGKPASKKDRAAAQVIRDMSSDQFAALKEAVSSGRL